jgi:hypothetical protein
MVSRALPMKETSSPPMTAVNMPAVGGKPLAIEIPRQSGRAMRKTKKPEPISDFQVLDKIFTLRDT